MSMFASLSFGAMRSWPGFLAGAGARSLEAEEVSRHQLEESEDNVHIQKKGGPRTQRVAAHTRSMMAYPHGISLNAMAKNI